MNQPKVPNLIVGVGASAGGLDAFKSLLAVLPADGHLTYILVQHLEPTHASLLVELLQPHCSMPVREARQNDPLSPDTVYVMRPDSTVAVKQGHFILAAPEAMASIRLPIDHLFHSIAHEYGPRAVGIVLSGTGNDGSAGLRAIRNVGGLTIAQDLQSSTESAMPQHAVETGAVQQVLAIPEIPRALERFAKFSEDERQTATLAMTAEANESLQRLSKQDVERIAATLSTQVNFDLHVYKLGTVERRVMRRMMLSAQGNVQSYITYLGQHASEQLLLVSDLLIGVTDFFRDQHSFEVLRKTVIQPMVAAARPGTTFRAWVPACATGEEAYSIGMEFLDAAESCEKRIGLQIFATDIDQEALAIGRTAIYPATIRERVGDVRLNKYFKLLDGRGYQVLSKLRDTVSFAVHDLTKDPPFSRMNLVSCRNVLIYLTTTAQEHVLKLLHFALQADGFLFLSSSESTGRQRHIFATHSKSHRIYRKDGASRSIGMPQTRARALERISVSALRSPRLHAADPPARGEAAMRALIDGMVPPSIVIAEDGAVLFSHGELSPYLHIPQGNRPRLDLQSMLRPELSTRTRSALYRSRRQNEVVVALSTADAEGRRVRITVRPAKTMGEGAAIVTFEEERDEQQAQRSVKQEATEAGSQDVVLDQLERELLATREDLRNTTEELEASNEELRSSNEESMSMNEELQSTNEELEVTTEELRSLNEELTTVNSQLREKIEQVEQAHDDLRNFFASTKVATIFLDDRLCIKRFTPSARQLLGVDHADEGRFVSDIARELLQADLEDESRDVLEHLTVRTREIGLNDGRWYSRQVLPYRTENRRIEGVVVTFTEVTELRSTNEVLDQKRHRLELAWEAARGGVFEYGVPNNSDTDISEQWAQMLGYSLNALPQAPQMPNWVVEHIHPDDQRMYQEAYQEFLRGDNERLEIEHRIRHRGGHYLWVRSLSKALARDDHNIARHVLGVMLDITALKEVEQSLRESERRFREMADGLPLMVWVTDNEGQNRVVNRTYRDFFSLDDEHATGLGWQELLHPDDIEGYSTQFFRDLAQQRPFHAHVRAKSGDGRWRWLECWAHPRLSPAGDFLGYVGTSADVTERKTLEAQMLESETRLKHLAENIAQLAWMSHGDGSLFWCNPRFMDYLGFDPCEELELARDAVHPDHREHIAEHRQQSIATGSRWRATFPLRGKDGQYRWFLGQAVPMHDGNGRVIRWCGTATDVTEQRDAEERLVEAGKQKDEFMAVLGHELRNPLSAMRSAAELLQGELDHNAVDAARAVLNRQSTHMARLVDGLLDVSRIIHGKIHLEFGTVDLRAVVRDVLADLDGRISHNGISVSTDLPTRPFWVQADAVRLSQIVENLLTNAVKYTPHGGQVRVVLMQTGDKANLAVEDTGVGIEPELLPHVFDAFKQSAQSLDRQGGGLGLGLALVRSLASLHGGTVEAHSDGLNQGAEFILNLPTITPTTPPPPAPKSERDVARRLRLVLIEDNEDAAQMLERLLKRRGHEVYVASEGQSGIQLVTENQPDAVLCDLGLPGELNGFDVARALRARPTIQSKLLALSGYGRTSDLRQSSEAGFDLHLTKPVTIDELEQALFAVCPL